MKRAITAVVTAIAFAFSVPSYAADQQIEPETPVTDAVYDAVLMRPFGLVAVGVGVAAFIIGLPITLPLGEAGRSADELVAAPLKYTFTRPIGDLRIGESEEWEKERIRQDAERSRQTPRTYRWND